MVKLLIFLQLAVGNLFLPREDTLKIVFAGDIMQHKEQLAAALVKKGNPQMPGSYNYDSYFKYLTALLNKFDIRSANMETCFTPNNFSGYPTFSSPVSLLKASKGQGFNLFFTANNHICDKGSKGLAYTIDEYEKNKIDYTGIGLKNDSLFNNNPLIVDIKGFRIAFLNYTYGTNGMRVPSQYRVNLLDSIKIAEDVKRAQNLLPDIIIASVHWGSEYVLTHSANQEKWERLFNKLGIKYIIGSHPHVPQEIRYDTTSDGYVKTYTVYSMGNCISNMTAPNTRIGLLVMLKFVKRGGEAKLLIPEREFIWTTRPGELEKNYAVVPVSIFKDKPEAFKNKESYNKMMEFYISFSNDR